MESVEAVIAG